MHNYYPVLLSAPLFKGLSEKDLDLLLSCLDTSLKHYEKDAEIVQPFSKIRHVGVVLEGRVQAMEVDANGNRNIFSHLGPSDLFGEVFICAGMTHIPLTVIASTKASILFLEFQRVMKRCAFHCSLHNQLIDNMLHAIANKTVSLNEKLRCLGCRTIREKVEAFLAAQMKHAGARCFEIPFSRTDMADYLCVDRSALSATLSRMRDEGVIAYHRNRFELLDSFVPSHHLEKQ